MLFTKKRLRLYLGGLLLLQFALFLRAIPYAFQGVMDYRTFYTAGFMVRNGAGSLLYDYATEYSLQNVVVTPSANALPFMSPAFTALLFVPFSWASYKISYLLFFGFNLLLLAASFAILRPHLSPLAALWSPLPALLFVTFLPVGIALVQGQLSFVLLLAFSAAYATLHRARFFYAGLFLSLVLIKFQLILPAIALFLLWRCWRVLLGFLTGCLPLALLSLLITGPAAQLAYLRSLFSMSSTLSTTAAQVRFGLYPARMPNLYGLFHTLIANEYWSQAFTLTASAALFLWAARQPASLPLATLVGLTVSYHLYLHDLSILLLPVCLVLSASIPSLAHQTGSPTSLNKAHRAALYTSLLLLLAPLGRLLIAADLIYLAALPVTFFALFLKEVGRLPELASLRNPALSHNPCQPPNRLISIITKEI